jgi:ribosome-associated translation inhibitor RaiA
MQTFNIRGKQVNIHNDNRIYVNGKDTQIKVWSSSSTKYSNAKSGQQMKEISGMDLESALYLKGWL